MDSYATYTLHKKQQGLSSDHLCNLWVDFYAILFEILVKFIFSNILLFLFKSYFIGLLKIANV